MLQINKTLEYNLLGMQVQTSWLIKSIRIALWYDDAQTSVETGKLYIFLILLRRKLLLTMTFRWTPVHPRLLSVPEISHHVAVNICSCFRILGSLRQFRREKPFLVRIFLHQLLKKKKKKLSNISIGFIWCISPWGKLSVLYKIQGAVNTDALWQRRASWSGKHTYMHTEHYQECERI